MEADLERQLNRLIAKWISLGRHPSRMHHHEERDTFNRCADDLRKVITAARKVTRTPDSHVELPGSPPHPAEVTGSDEK